MEAPTASEDDEWMRAGEVDMFALTGNAVGYEIRVSDEFAAVVAEEASTDEGLAGEYADLAEAVWVQTRGLLVPRLAESARFTVYAGAERLFVMSAKPPGARPRVDVGDE